ncbi:MAG: YbaB/EbfC family nucleoid-associated protein [Betaproteobacteria bacterium]|nr:YbaB/EbfC family nucleoid-associated protein [Betaproteobacteria bacterium]
MDINKFGDFFKNARRLHEQLEKTRQELNATEITGEAGGGMVRIVLVGGRRVRRVEIDPSLLGDAEMLQDLLAGAITDALRKSETLIGEKMQSSVAAAAEDK